MSLHVVSLVLFGALCHATWNAFDKATDDRIAGLVAICLGILSLAFCWGRRHVHRRGAPAARAGALGERP